MNKVANGLLEIKAVHLSPNDLFTWASGIKSPIYCDNRLILSYPEVRTVVKEELSNLVKETYPEVECVIGTATAGIPHATLVADELNLPNAYVRSGAKKHGLGKQIEGNVPAGSKVVVIEDLISTGKSSIEVVEILKANDIEVLAVVSIVNYGFKKAVDNFANANVPTKSLVTMDMILDQAVANQDITKEDQEFIIDWKSQF